MKKIFIALILGLSISSTLNAQTAQDSISTTQTEEKKYYPGIDIYTQFQEDLFGFGAVLPTGKIWGASMDFDWGKYSWGSTTQLSIGLGLVKRAIFGDSFLLQGRVMPYVGFLGTSFKDDSMSNKDDFAYGARAKADIGFQIYRTKKSNEGLFITFGYRIDAPEFETKNMFENGWWSIGLTVVSF